MTKERAKEIADMIGVELDEIFCVIIHENNEYTTPYAQCTDDDISMKQYYKLNEKGLFMRHITDREWKEGYNCIFVDLITGEADIIKLDKRYRPMKGDPYYVPNPLCDNDNVMYVARRWEESKIDTTFYDKHMTFRIPEEARDMALRMVSLAMYGEDNNDEDEDD